MKQVFYVLASIAAALFILSWGFENYTAYVQTRDGAASIAEELPVALGEQTFAYCSGQWPNDRVLQNTCDRDEYAGVRAFYGAWTAAQTSSTARLSAINCFLASQTQYGRDWSVAGNCAARS